MKHLNIRCSCSQDIINAIPKHTPQLISLNICGDAYVHGVQGEKAIHNLKPLLQCKYLTQFNATHITSLQGKPLHNFFNDLRSSRFILHRNFNINPEYIDNQIIQSYVKASPGFNYTIPF